MKEPSCSFFWFYFLLVACHFSQRFPRFPRFPSCLCLALLLHLLVCSTWHCSVGWLLLTRLLPFFYTIFWTGREFVFHAFFHLYLGGFDFTLAGSWCLLWVHVCVEWHLTKLWHTRRCGQNAGNDADDDDGGGSQICQEAEDELLDFPAASNRSCRSV